MNVYEVGFEVSGQGGEALHTGAVCLELELEGGPVPHIVKAAVAAWAAENVPGAALFDSTGRYVHTGGVTPVDHPAEMTQEQYWAGLQTLCRNSLRMHAAWAETVEKWVKPQAAWEDDTRGYSSSLRIAAGYRHVLGIWTPGTRGTHYTSSAGPNSELSFSGYLPGADTLEKAKQRCYDSYLELRDPEHGKKRKGDREVFAWENQEELCQKK